MLQNRSWLVLAASLCIVTPSLAQPGGGGGRGNASLLEAGSMLPKVTLYDDRGEEFSTNSLRGQYSVLVFGCLT